MYVREYCPEDLKEIGELFYQTVHCVNIKDYTEAQVNAWADGSIDEERWNTLFLQHYSLTAVEKDRIVGFGDIDSSGYLDKLYIHKDFQRRGIAALICDQLEGSCQTERVTVHASATAKPFFEKRGYRLVKEQQVQRHGVYMTNFIMEMHL